MGDTKVRVHTNQLQQGILHRENAAIDSRTLRINVCFPLEDFRKALKHTLGYLLMLFRSQWGQFTKMIICLSTQKRYTLQHILS